MILYILKFSACLALLICFYRLFLEKESIHQFKRFYLLGAVLLSLVIPLIYFNEYIPASELTQTTVSGQPEKGGQHASSLWTWEGILPQVLWTIYFIGLLIFGIRFALNLRQISLKIKNNPKQKYLQFTNVLLTDLISPHTFFNYIFLNKNKFESDQIPEEVLIHEQTHAEQKHALDILIIEFIQVIFWFNPIVPVVKKDIKLNHEFLADQAVIKNGIDTKSYQNLLLVFSSNTAIPPLANAINYSLIKKRFTIMKTKTSKQSTRIRSLVLLPLLALLIYSFSSRNLIEIPTEFQETPITFDSEILPDIINQKSASREQMAEYNAIVKKLNAQPENERIIRQKDVERIKYIYSLMSDKQKADAEPFPKFPPAPPKVKEKSKSEKAAQLVVLKEKATKQQAQLARIAEVEERQDAQNAAKIVELQKKQELQKVKLSRATKLQAKQKVLKAEKLKYKEEKDNLKAAKIAYASQLKENQDALKAEKVAYAKAKKARAAAKDENSKAMTADKLKYTKEQDELKAAKIAYAAQAQEKNDALKAEKIKYVKAKAAMADAKKVKAMQIGDVPPPPPPVSVLEHAKNMADKGAIFYLEGKEISTSKALKIVKSKRKINISTIGPDSDQPKVYLSRKPIEKKN
jgi:beta-lactamase regulating signal transducer with metallopeptidase domain